MRAGSYGTPDGKKVKAKTVTEKRTAYNFYFNKTVLPWFKDYIKPWTIVYITKYLKGTTQMYWGALISSVSAQNALPIKKMVGNKFDETKKELYIDLIRNGQGKLVAARKVGIHERTVGRHLADDPEFKKAVSLAQTEVNQKIENALFEAAISGNVTAIQVYLYNRNPERWADRRSVRLAGEGGGPIEVRESDAKSKLISMLNRLSERSKEECQSQ